MILDVIFMSLPVKKRGIKYFNVAVDLIFVNIFFEPIAQDLAPRPNLELVD